MMLALAGRGPDEKSDPDLYPFAFFLAHQLHKTITEVENMTHREFVAWHAYFEAKHAFENPTRVTR